MREAEVEAAFVAYLIERGWDVATDKADRVDVVAKRGAELLVAEVKGKTSSAGLDVDTLYGQLLRRMDRRGDEVHYAVVVPSAPSAAVPRPGVGAPQARHRGVPCGRLRPSSRAGRRRFRWGRVALTTAPRFA